ncbi:MAG: hypothetical protein FOGNACKC_04076 [Anaerolineae bacterium]|nr:hypothetical protein [Anaerolineae bacterium]
MMMPEQAPPVDWEQLHRRLEKARALSDRSLVPSPEDKQRLLKKRAKMLARVVARPPDAASFFQIAVFTLSGVSYAAELACIRDVFPLKELTPIPCTPPFIAGMVNVRGQILPVIDLEQFFDLPRHTEAGFKEMIILHAGDTELGLLADSIIGVRSIPIAAIQPSLATAPDRQAGYIKGVTPEPLIIIDPVKILADPRLIVNEEVD